MLTNLLNVFCCASLFDVRILLLLLSNNKLTWTKSRKFFIVLQWEMELNSLFKALISNLLWRISSHDNFNWYFLYPEEVWKDWLLTWNTKETSKNEHNWTPLKYLNVLRHNRTQKQSWQFFLNILQKCYQLPIFGTLNISGHLYKKG